MAQFAKLTDKETETGIVAGLLEVKDEIIVSTDYGKASSLVTLMKNNMDNLYRLGMKPSPTEIRKLSEVTLEIYKYLQNEEKGYDRTSTPLPVR